MRIPEGLAPLFEYGIIEDVVRPLMSGKEAQVYLVTSGGELRVAKVYKEAQNRTFKNRAEYTEGRKVRNSRDQRAIEKRSKHGRAQDEAAWRSTEVDMIHRLHGAGVRVPVPHHFIDGVLIMELIVDAEGNPAPRLGDLGFDPDAARAMYDRLIREVVRMLCAGVVHGDLSDFNVLVGSDGPVVIDFPQSVDTAHNTNARRLLLRDVDNMHRFLTRFVPGARRMPYAEEMWDLYQQNLLTPETKLGGRYTAAHRRVDTAGVLDLIQDANRDERKRREGLGLRGGPPAGPPAADGPRPPHHDVPHRGYQRGGPPRDGRPAQPSRDGLYQSQDAGPVQHPRDGQPAYPSHDARPLQHSRDNRPMQAPRDNRPAHPSRDNRPMHHPRDGRPAPPPRDNVPAQQPSRDGGPAQSPRDNRHGQPPRDNRPAQPPRDNRPAHDNRPMHPSRDNRPRPGHGRSAQPSGPQPRGPGHGGGHPRDTHGPRPPNAGGRPRSPGPDAQRPQQGGRRPGGRPAPAQGVEVIIVRKPK